MKILSWNVNGIRAATKKDFFKSVNDLGPDVLCLQETKAQADEAARIEAEEAAKRKAEAQAKAQAAEQKAKSEAELDAVRQKRAAEREKLAASRANAVEEEVSKTPAAVQKSMTDKMVESLDWIHKRI